MRNDSINIFENRLDILIFAAHSRSTFTVSDIFEAVLEAQRVTIRKCLKDLVNAGYLEKVTIYDYKATDKAKQLFGAQA